MFALRTKNSFTGLLVALVLLVGIYMAMDNMLQQTKVIEAPEMPEPGRSILSEELLAPFRDKWSSQDLQKKQETLAQIGHRLQSLSRQDFEGYLAVNIGITQMKSAPLRYVGQTLPLTFTGAGNLTGESSDGLSQFRILSSEGQNFHIAFVSNYSGNILSPTYAEVVFLGITVAESGQAPLIEGVALELFELPKDGRFPKMASDTLALSLVIDDMSSPDMQKMTRNVSPLTMSHFFSKIQDGDIDKLPITKATYTQLMEAPDRYRAQKIDFSGTLIFKKKNRLKAEGVPPGMDMYEEGFLLNSDQISYVFRMPKIPETFKIKDIVRVEGYFLQRYNYLNRLDRATWTPLILASKIEKVEEFKVVMTPVEKGGILTILSLLGIGFLWVVFRKQKFYKPQRLHKTLKINKK